MSLPLNTRVMIGNTSGREVAEIAAVFAKLGYTQTDQGGSAAVVMRRLHTMTFGLIYLDWNFDAPANGSFMLSLLRTDFRTKHLPIIMAVETRHVGYAREMHRETLLDGWLYKPPTAGTLQAVLDQLNPPYG